MFIFPRTNQLIWLKSDLYLRYLTLVRLPQNQNHAKKFYSSNSVWEYRYKLVVTPQEVSVFDKSIWSFSLLIFNVSYLSKNTRLSLSPIIDRYFLVIRWSYILPTKNRLKWSAYKIINVYVYPNFPITRAVLTIRKPIGRIFVEKKYIFRELTQKFRE